MNRLQQRRLAEHWLRKTGEWKCFKKTEDKGYKGGEIIWRKQERQEKCWDSITEIAGFKRMFQKVPALLTITWKVKGEVKTNN